MQVYVTPRAEKNFSSITNYIGQKWGERTARQFIQKTDEFFLLLKNYPLIGQVEKDDIRGFQLSTQTRILYRIEMRKLLY
jgi:plasmid stabilization system protein ParE